MDAKGGVRSVGSLTPKGSEKGRYQFKHEGRLIYEWDQSLEDVNIYVKPPPGVTADIIFCDLKPGHMQLGLRGNPPFLDEPTGGPIVVKESRGRRGVMSGSWSCNLSCRLDARRGLSGSKRDQSSDARRGIVSLMTSSSPQATSTWSTAR